MVTFQDNQQSQTLPPVERQSSTTDPGVSQNTKTESKSVVANTLKKSGLFLGLLLFIMLVGAGIGGYFISGKKLPFLRPTVSPEPSPILISSSPTPTFTPKATVSASPEAKTSPTPFLPTTKRLIHLYPAYGANPNTQINKIHIISLLFVPKDIDTVIKSEWLVNIEKIDSKIKGFFEKQFAYNIEISYKTVPQPVEGVLNISEYTPNSLVLEAKERTNYLIESSSHNIWMIYLVRDPEYKKNIIGGNLGGLADLQAATQFEFWLDNEAINSPDQYGLKGSAHEFAHVLGIPHPWELPSNTNHDPNYGNVPGDLMGYSNSGLNLDSLYIRDDVKKEMGL